MRNSWIWTSLFAAALAAPATAAPPDDAWLAWIGCWRADGDTSNRALCIVPDGDGVRLLKLKGSAVESEARIVANGQSRPIAQEGCTGNEIARWSADRKRLYIKADLNCGNNTLRAVSGMFAVLSSTQWAHVQAIGRGENQQLLTVRYVETEPADLPPEIAQAFRDNRLARETVRLAAAARLELDDVRDAVAHVETGVVESWLTTVGQEFNLNGEKLIALADAGVPSSVIDVLVALSNPQHFAVREERAADRIPWGGRRPASCWDSWHDPYDPFGYRYSRYSYNYDYGCGRRGWGFYPTWGGGYYGGGGVIVIQPSTPRSRGRVTRQGYRAPRDETAASRPATTTERNPAPSVRPSGDDSSSGSSGGGGRKAKPRDN